VDRTRPVAGPRAADERDRFLDDRRQPQCRGQADPQNHALQTGPEMNREFSTSHRSLSSFPAKAGIQGRQRPRRLPPVQARASPGESRGQALDPRVPACEEIDDHLDQHSVSFETAASQLPQDEEFSLNAIKGLPHAEEPSKGVSRSTHGRIAGTFFTSSFAG
jgi:hypothetical protein